MYAKCVFVRVPREGVGESEIRLLRRDHELKVNVKSYAKTRVYESGSHTIKER